LHPLIGVQTSPAPCRMRGNSEFDGKLHQKLSRHYHLKMRSPKAVVSWQF
jgi:hypothetical protein